MDYYKIAKKLLYELVSVYSPPGKEEGVRKAIIDFADEFGLGYEIDNIGNIRVFLDSGSNAIGLSLVSHMDTVTGFLPVKIVEDFLYGRGAVDAKGPLASMLLSLLMIKDKDYDRFFYQVYALVDEEGESKGARELVNRGVNLSHTIIGEPTNNQICLGYRGRTLLRLSCKALGGHASSPEIGESALDKVLELYKLIRFKLNRYGISTAITRLNAGEDDNVLPTTADALIDIRSQDSNVINLVLGAIQETVVEKNCFLEVLSSVEPVYSKVSDTIVRAIQKTLLKYGSRIVFVKKRGTSDMNILYRISKSIIAYGPGDPVYAHTSLERINIRDIVFASKVYAGVYQELYSLLG